MFPKGLQWFRAPKSKYKVWRYPAVGKKYAINLTKRIIGSEPTDHDYNKMDYKTAYRDSIYNVRYTEDIKKNLLIKGLMTDPISDTIERK